ncbi:MAG: hypothetical protein K8R87_03480 [Verrucomicrobia bacterium]|nr:hypothetical protein [Verrucomicrobiota bacterium]
MASIAPSFPIEADFSDRLNPLLVKELRQGLRNRVFVSSFLLVHAFVAIAIGFETLSIGFSGEQSGNESWMALQWAAEVLFVCILLPMRALTATEDEVRASAPDLLRLANYDAGAVIFGKWKTQLLLSSVLLVSLAPYHFLRFYVGGADVISQTLALLWAWSESAMLSALCLCLSTLRVWARCIWIAVLLIPLWITLVPPSLLLFGHIDGSGIVVALIVWSVVWFGATMFFLTLAISGFDTQMRYRHLAE